MVGASNIVGKPLALMLMQREATVAICHAKTRDLAQYTILADIHRCRRLADLIVPAMVHTAAVIESASIFFRRPRSAMSASQRAPQGWHITPVPGGVGP